MSDKKSNEKNSAGRVTAGELTYRRKNLKNNLLTYALVIAAFAILQSMQNAGNLTSLIKGLLVPSCVYVILALSLNLVVGISGELSLGHAGFMCVGAFVSAFFSKCTSDIITVTGLRFALAILLGALAAGIFGILIGIPVLRLRGDYLAIVTLAFGEIIKNVINIFYIGLDSSGFHVSFQDQYSLGMASDGKVILNGPQGITGTPKNSTFLAGIILILITLVIVQNLINSRDGRAIKAIRDNRIAAESIGINITKYKLMAFSVSAALAGAAGALYAHNLAVLQASKFNFNTSILALVFVVLGGIGNMRGSIIAAVLLTVLPEMLRFLNDYRMLIYAIVLIVMMLFNWAPKAIQWRERYLGRFFKTFRKGSRIESRIESGEESSEESRIESGEESSEESRIESGEESSGEIKEDTREESREEIREESREEIREEIRKEGR